SRIFGPVERGPAQGGDAGRVSETRKIAAILVADIVGCSRLAGADRDRTLSRLRGLRSDLIDPAIDAHHGRIVKPPATAASSNSAVSSTPCAARSKCRTASSSAMPAFLWIGGS